MLQPHRPAARHRCASLRTLSRRMSIFRSGIGLLEGPIRIGIPVTAHGCRRLLARTGRIRQFMAMKAISRIHVFQLEDGSKRNDILRFFFSITYIHNKVNSQEQQQPANVHSCQGTFGISSLGDQNTISRTRNPIGPFQSTFVYYFNHLRFSTCQWSFALLHRLSLTSLTNIEPPSLPLGLFLSPFLWVK